MADAKPAWWRRFKRQMAFAEIRRLQELPPPVELKPQVKVAKKKWAVK